MSCGLQAIQQQITQLPRHILAIDLLIFRRGELETPTPWPTLVEYCIILLRAVELLRQSGLDISPSSSRTIPLSRTGDTPFIDNAEAQLDSISPQILYDAYQWAQSHPGSQSLSPTGCTSSSYTLSIPTNATEETLACEQLATLIEERLSDILLEIKHSIRKGRKAPRKALKNNLLAQTIWNAKQVLGAKTSQQFVALAQQIGPLPEETIGTHDSFVKSASGANV